MALRRVEAEGMRAEENYVLSRSAEQREESEKFFLGHQKPEQIPMQSLTGKVLSLTNETE